MSKKRLAILGSTGSIGTQALEIVSAHEEQFEVAVLTANNNAELLIQQAKKFRPNCVVIANEQLYKQVEEELWQEDIKTYTGHQAISDVVQMDEVDLVLAGIVGVAGLDSTIAAIQAGKNIALANKEALVVAGEMITKLAAEKGVNIYPVDSEHSAIFQCIVGEFQNPIEKVYLTASGGPFRGKNLEELSSVTKAQALNHPNWEMGEKITIDSATMMNKGLEVIEAKWMFGLKPEQIEIIVHPESIIHSLVQFKDGAMKAQMGLPDMKVPIQFAFSYPGRLHTDSKRFNFMDYPSLNFEPADFKTFKNLQLAYDALERKGNVAAALNAVNEVSVAAFLSNQISFLKIADINQEVCDKISFTLNPSLEELIDTDAEARVLARELL